MEKVLLKGISLEALQEFVQAHGQPRFRARQLFLWMYKRKASTFAEMTDLPAAFRQQLE